MSEQQQPTIIVERGRSAFGAFVWGAVCGAAAALLFAPKTGKETQEELKEGAKRLREGAEEKFREVRESVGEGYEKARADVTEKVGEVRKEVEERKKHAEQALRAGKDAAQKARGDLEKRLSESKAAYKAALAEEEEEEEAAEEEVEAST